MLSIINENLVIIDDACKSKNKILQKMTELLYEQKRISDKNKFYKEILSREKIQTTGIGENIGIPHAKSKTVRNLSVIIALCKKGINFNSFDKQPVKIIFMVAAPENMNQVYLQIITKIARLLKNIKWRNHLLQANSNEEIINLIKDFDKTYPDKLKIKLHANGRVLLQE